MPMNYSRQLDLANPAAYEDREVTVIGAGGIGAGTTLALAKVGFARITVHDFDRLEAVNFPNQLLPVLHPSGGTWEGSDKVLALHWLVKVMTETEIQVGFEPFAQQPLSEIVILAVDNMVTRRLVWERARADPAVALFIDGRMARWNYQVYCLDLLKAREAQHRRYEATLFPDSEAAAVPCTEKATAPTNFRVAGTIAKLCVDWALGRPVPNVLLDVFEHWTQVADTWT